MHRFLSSACLLAALASSPLVIAEEPAAPAASPAPEAAAASVEELDTSQELTLKGPEQEANDARWFWHLGMTSAFPRIESEGLVKKLYDPIMGALAPGYDPVQLVGDYRDIGVLFAPQIGLGRRIGDHLTLTLHGGWAGGKVRTKQDAMFWIPFINIHNDFEIYRGAGYVDFGADIYPFKHTVLKDYGSWKERLKAAKPKVALSTTFTMADYKAKVHIGIDKLNFLPHIGVKVTDEWFLQSYKTRVGLEVPINRRNILSFDIAYNFFEEQQHDFNGPIVSVIWQHYWER